MSTSAPGPVPGLPGAVPGNRWDLLDAPEPGAWTPTRRVTVVVPHYEAPAELGLTLAALASQTYPRELTEVVVVDDGSDPPLTLVDPPEGLEVRVVHQEDRGFGLARARNNGAREATGDILLFLDGDMLPEPDWMEAHARWHHVCSHAVTLGFRWHVDVAGVGVEDVAGAAGSSGLAPLFAERRRWRPEWVERHLERSDEARIDEDGLFRICTGGNLGVRAETFFRAGAFDETFTQWGSEDTELGYRLHVDGAVLVPERRAVCWHQGYQEGLDDGERRSLDEQRARLSQLVPHPVLRRMRPGRSFAVPSVVVRLAVGGADEARLTATLESVLAGSHHDLEVVVDLPDDHPDRVRIRRLWGGDPRVRFAPRPEHDRVPFVMDLPVGLVLASDAVERCVRRLRDAGDPAGVLYATVPDADPDEVRLRLVATRARRRARHAGARDEVAAAAALFGQAWCDGADLGLAWADAPESPDRRRARPPRSTDPEVVRARRRLLVTVDTAPEHDRRRVLAGASRGADLAAGVVSLRRARSRTAVRDALARVARALLPWSLARRVQPRRR